MTAPSTRLARALAAAGAMLAMALTARAEPPASSALRDRWPEADLRTLASMHLDAAGPRPADPSNAYEARADAAALGRRLFGDARFSADGKVSCATCHAPERGFEDGKPLGEGQARGRRRTMPVMGAAHSPFLFWDGRKDSLWSQALGPLEDAAEHGGTRARFVRLVQEHHADAYAGVFGPLPPLRHLPADASPLGSAAEQAAWARLAPDVQDQVNRVFANLGKALAAYESRLAYGPSRFDRYVRATLAGDGAGQAALTPREARGLRLFLHEGQCATCHQGPLLTDHAFHNTGVPPLERSRPDAGRAAGVRKLLRDEFNCLGPYSDARPQQCGELNFLAVDDPAHVGAFRTPSLRNVATRPPYMHAGQFATLDEVVRHYATSPKAAVGHSELARAGARHDARAPIRLSADDIGDLAAFLGSLTGPVLQPD